MLITVEFPTSICTVVKVLKESEEEFEVMTGDREWITINYPSIEDYNMMQERCDQIVPHKVLQVLCDTEWEHGCALMRFKKIIKPILIQKS